MAKREIVIQVFGKEEATTLALAFLNSRESDKVRTFIEGDHVYIVLVKDDLDIHDRKLLEAASQLFPETVWDFSERGTLVSQGGHRWYSYDGENDFKTAKTMVRERQTPLVSLLALQGRLEQAYLACTTPQATRNSEFTSLCYRTGLEIFQGLSRQDNPVFLLDALKIWITREERGSDIKIAATYDAILALIEEVSARVLIAEVA